MAQARWDEPAERSSDLPVEEAAPSAFPLRLVNADARELLERFRDSPLLGAGKLSMLGLEAIAERLGARWPSRRNLVHEHTERVLQKGLGAGALIQRIGETEYLVANSELPRAAGRVRCLNCLREILTHFLGEAPADLRVHEITRITDDGVFGQGIDSRQAEAEENTERQAAAPAAGLPPLDRWTPFSTSAGLNVGVSCALEPVLHLRTSSQIGYRVASRVQHRRSLTALSRADYNALSAADLQKIDFAVVARGIERARAMAAERRPLALILPTSFTTLQSRGGRATILGLMRQGRDYVEHGLVCDLTAIEGAPVAALHETVAALRPYCLHIIARLVDPAQASVADIIGAGVVGFSARRPPASQDADFVGWLGGLTHAIGKRGKPLFLYQAADLRQARVAAELGVTHATLAPQRVKLHLFDDEPV